MTKADLNKLKKRLPKGYGPTAVALLLGRGKKCTQQYVSQVLLGLRSDDVVIEVLCEIAEKHEAKQADLQRRARGIKTIA